MAQQQKQGSEEVPALPHGSAARTFHDQQNTVLGCAHYKRRHAPPHESGQHGLLGHTSVVEWCVQS